MNKKIIFTSGGTGGHIFPAINLMQHFSKKEYDVLLVTDFRGKNLLKNFSNIKSHVINTDVVFTFLVIFLLYSFHYIFVFLQEMFLCD